MHIPDISKAVAEISRITSKNGIVIIGVTNYYSIHIQFFSFIRRIRRKSYKNSVINEFGKEIQDSDINGDINFTRYFKTGRLIDEFHKHGLNLIKKYQNLSYFL